MSIMRFFLVILVLLISSAHAESFIKVLGECKKPVVPDREKYILTFTQNGKNSSELQDAISKRAQKLIDQLKSELTDSIILKTTQFQSFPRYEYIKGQSEFKGFNVRYTLSIELKNFEKRNKLQEIARNSKAEEWAGPSFEISDELNKETRNACLKMALEDARQKAEIIALASKVKLTTLNFASETLTQFSPMPMMKGNFESMSMMSSQDQTTAPPIEIKEIDYQSQLEAAFNFKTQD